MPIETLTTFFLASLLLALTPGPDNIFVLTQSVLNGRKAGILVTLGLCTGLFFHSTAVALGVSAIIQTSGLAFISLKIVGVFYLVYMAWQAFKTSNTIVNSNKENRLTCLQLYRRGFIMNVTNPKVSIFFLAFLPQFCNLAYGTIIPQIFALGTLFMIATVLVFDSIAILSGPARQWLNQSQKTNKVLHWTAGAVFLGLAIKLALTVK